MKKEIFENGVRFLYEYRDTAHSSFCIGLEAGATMEEENNIGVAHALEHFLFKGTKELNEDEINKRIDKLFGFSNAMTNFPYVIYYGTTFNDDFQEGFNLYSDIVLKPSFSEVGFKEEIDIIKQELLDWKADSEQYCEDKLLENALNDERIGKRIIGIEKAIENITIEKLKGFHKKFYVSENMVISVVSSLPIELVREVVYKNFGKINKAQFTKKDEGVRRFKAGIFKEEKNIDNTAKLQFIFDIASLNRKEIKILKILNMYLGEGVSSLLYDEIRTKKGLAYELSSVVKWEKSIKLFSIVVSTSPSLVEKTKYAVDNVLEKIKGIDISEVEIKELVKRYRMKSSLEIERSIVLANRMAIHEVLNDEGERILVDANTDFIIKKEDLKEVIEKVFKNPAVEILV